MMREVSEKHQERQQFCYCCCIGLYIEFLVCSHFIQPLYSLYDRKSVVCHKECFLILLYPASQLLQSIVLFRIMLNKSFYMYFKVWWPRTEFTFAKKAGTTINLCLSMAPTPTTAMEVLLKTLPLDVQAKSVVLETAVRLYS